MLKIKNIYKASIKRGDKMFVYGLLITGIGMLSVFIFLFFLMEVLNLTAFLIRQTQKTKIDDKVVAAIAVAMKQGE